MGLYLLALAAWHGRKQIVFDAIGDASINLPSERLVKNIRRATRKRYSAEDEDPCCPGRPAG
jgi:hypothetical protein